MTQPANGSAALSADFHTRVQGASPDPLCLSKRDLERRQVDFSVTGRTLREPISGGDSFAGVNVRGEYGPYSSDLLDLWLIIGKNSGCWREIVKHRTETKADDYDGGHKENVGVLLPDSHGKKTARRSCSLESERLFRKFRHRVGNAIGFHRIFSPEPFGETNAQNPYRFDCTCFHCIRRVGQRREDRHPTRSSSWLAPRLAPSPSLGSRVASWLAQSPPDGRHQAPLLTRKGSFGSLF